VLLLALRRHKGRQFLILKSICHLDLFQNICQRPFAVKTSMSYTSESEKHHQRKQGINLYKENEVIDSMNSSLKYPLAAMCAFHCTALTLFAQTFTNNNPLTTVVPYGGTYTYSVSWGGGGPNPLEVDYLEIPSRGLAVMDEYPNPGTFTYTINGVTGNDQGRYLLEFYGGVSYPNSPPVNLYISPAILTQPENTICVSGGATAMGMACGPTNATTFQWFDAATESPITTATNTPVFTPTTTTNTERIYCQIINAYGQVTSTNALLIVGTAPTITAQPSNVSVVFGNSATLSVTAIGTQPLYYQWYQNGFPIPGANIDYITLSQVTNTDIQTLSVVVSNAFGQTISAIAMLISGSTPQALTASLENDSSVNLQTIGTPGFTYVLQVTTNLVIPNWQSVVTNSTDINGVWSFIDTNTQLCPAKFYRITTP
jgi:hypothetical protein